MSKPVYVSAILAWDVTADTAMNYLYQKEDYFEIAHSPVDNILAISKGFRSPDKIELYNSETFEYIRTLDNSDYAYYTLKFSSDGQYLSAGGSKGIRIWDVSSGNLDKHFNQLTNQGGVTNVLFFINPLYFLSRGLNIDGLPSTKIWNLQTEAMLFDFDYFHGIAPAISSDGSLFFLDSAGKVFMFSVSYPGNRVNSDEEKSFNLYPNPAGDILNINVSEFSAEANAEIYNVLGSLVATHKITGDALRIDISALPAGVYVARIGNRVRSFVIAK